MPQEEYRRCPHCEEKVYGGADKCPCCDNYLDEEGDG